MESGTFDRRRAFDLRLKVLKESDLQSLIAKNVCAIRYCDNGWDGENILLKEGSTLRAVLREAALDTLHKWPSGFQPPFVLIQRLQIAVAVDPEILNRTVEPGDLVLVERFQP